MTKDNQAPFFIVGAGRSGSTLFRLILASHSRIAIPPETWFLLDLARDLPLRGLLSPGQVERAIRLMTGQRRWADLDIEKEALEARARAIPEPTVRTVADVVYQIICERAAKARWGDKTPRYVRIVPQLAELYPGAKFIHLIRDGRDVARSFQKQGWGGRWLYANAAEWIEAVDYINAYREEIARDQLLEVRYEDLVLKTEETTRRVCAFLGEEFEPAMLAWEGSVRDRVPDWELSYHQKLFRQPKREDVQRWKRDLTPLQTLFLEAHIGERLSQAGYRARYRSAASRAVFPILRAGCRSLGPVLEAAIQKSAPLRAKMGLTRAGLSGAVR